MVKRVMAEVEESHAIATIPNFITLARLALLPLAVYLAASRANFIAASVLLGFISLTDFLDGYLARRLHQVSLLGKIMDPSVDRVVILTIGITALAEGWLPLALGVVIFFREAMISAISAYLFKAKGHRLDVIWFGKAGTMALLIALPAILLGQQRHPDLGLFHQVGLFFAIVGTLTLYYAASIYIRRDLLPELRAAKKL